MHFDNTLKSHGVRLTLCRLGLSILLAASCQVARSQVIPAASPAAATPAAVTKSQDPLNRESPQSSIVAFLEACHAHQYEKAWKYLDLRDSTAQQRLEDGPELARELEQILDRDAQFDVATLSRAPEGDRNDTLPPDRERLDAFKFNGQTMTLELQRVALRSGIQIWLVSSDSLRLIPQIAKLTSSSPIERYLPNPLVKWRLIDTALWRWIALALLAALLAIVSRWLSRLVLFLAEPVLLRIAPHFNRGALEEFSGPVRLLLSIIAFRAAMEWIDPSALLRLWLGRGLTLLAFAGFAWLGAAVTDLIIRRLRVILGGRHQNVSYSVLPVVSRVMKLTIWLLAFAAVLGSWGYNATTIMAGLGVGGLAIALAAQKTIENLFGGVSVINDRPVSVGDFCKFGDRVGTVEDIGLRSTRIRTLDRTVVTVPNSQFSSMMLENFNKRDKMLFHFTLNLRRDTTSEQVRTLLSAVTKLLTEHPQVEAGSLPVRFVGVGSYSLDLEIFAYVLTPLFDEFLKLQQELLLAILDAVEAAGTALALPTQANVEYPAVNARDKNDGPKKAPMQHELANQRA
jgi:MscS family membrane protein